MRRFHYVRPDIASKRAWLQRDMWSQFSRGLPLDLAHEYALYRYKSPSNRRPADTGPRNPNDTEYVAFLCQVVDLCDGELSR